MYGTNPIAKGRVAPEGFMVHSLWFTIQGEGPFAGMPAIFLRLAGCNLRCFYCDTEFDEGARLAHGMALAEQLKLMVDTHHCKFIVITGGEPMLQPLHLLVDNPELRDCKFQIETAGTYWPLGGLMEYPSRDRLSIVVSPKTPVLTFNLRNADVYDVYWKYIIRASEPTSDLDGLPTFSTQTRGSKAQLFRPIFDSDDIKSRIYVQACDEESLISGEATHQNQQAAAAIAMQHGYRLSFQMHKVIGLD